MDLADRDVMKAVVLTLEALRIEVRAHGRTVEAVIASNPETRTSQWKQIKDDQESADKMSDLASRQIEPINL